MSIPLSSVPALAEGAARITDSVLRLLAEPSAFVPEPPLPNAGELYAELAETLEEGLPALVALAEDIPTVDPDDMDDLFDELEDIALDLAELRLLALLGTENAAEAGFYHGVAALAELPLFGVLAFLAGVKRLAIAPWSEEENRVAPEFLPDVPAMCAAYTALRATPAGQGQPPMPLLEKELGR